MYFTWQHMMICSRQSRNAVRASRILRSLVESPWSLYQSFFCEVFVVAAQKVRSKCRQRAPVSVWHNMIAIFAGICLNIPSGVQWWNSPAVGLLVRETDLKSMSLTPNYLHCFK